MRNYSFLRLGPAIFAAALILSSGAARQVTASLLDCGIDLGAAGPYAHGTHTRGWAAFTLGGGVKAEDDFTGSAAVHGGDVGVAGNGDFDMSGNSEIDLDVWQHTGGTFKRSGNATIHGTRFQDAAHDTELDQGVIDAMNADDAAWNLGNTMNDYPAITSIQTGNNYTLMATDNCTVLKLTNFKLTGGTFTLQGTATQHFIINVSNTFSLSGGAKIMLSGGITFDNVLFNVRGTGSDVSITGSSSMTGILLATKRTVRLTGSTVDNGEVIADRLVMSGGSQINLPPVVSE